MVHKIYRALIPPLLRDHGTTHREVHMQSKYCVINLGYGLLPSCGATPLTYIIEVPQTDVAFPFPSL